MINPEELNLKSLPWLLLDACSAFPRQPAIYFAIDVNDIIQYIGMSNDPKQRWSKHHQYEKLKAMGQIKIVFLFVEEKKLLPSIEAVLIKWYKPLLNQQNKKDSSTCEKGSRKRRLNGLGKGTIFTRSVTKGKNTYQEYWFKYVKGDRQKSLYISKTKLSRVKEMNEEKQPVNDIINYINGKDKSTHNKARDS